MLQLSDEMMRCSQAERWGTAERKPGCLDVLVHKRDQGCAEQLGLRLAAFSDDHIGRDPFRFEAGQK